MPVARIEAKIVVLTRSPRKICFSGVSWSLGVSLLLLLRLGEDLGVVDVAPHVEDQQRRQDAEHHQDAPALLVADQREHDRVGDDGERPADRPRALDHAERLAAGLGPDQLGDQDRADGPLAAEADALEDAEHEQHLVARREARQEREDRVDADGEHQRARTADAVREDTTEDAADRRSGERDGGERAGRALADAEGRADRRQRQRQDDQVEGVQRVARERGLERLLPAAAEGAPPAPLWRPLDRLDRVLLGRSGAIRCLETHRISPVWLPVLPPLIGVPDRRVMHVTSQPRERLFGAANVAISGAF